MITYPDIDPVAFSLGPIQVHWYGLTYIVGIFGAWVWARYQSKKLDYHLSNMQIDDLIFYIAMGLVLGGRVGYTLFYNFPAFLSDPIVLFKVWEGGMSFHGGMIGGFLTAWYFAKKNGFGFFELSDFYTPLVPIGLFAGRIGNFINGELWGKQSNLPWAMIFPGGGSVPRHPSQLYEAFMEGIVLFILLYFYTRQPKPRMATTGLALLLYGSFRFAVEFVRLPDPHIGYLVLDWLTMGQLLTLPMMIIGSLLIYLAYSWSSTLNVK